VCVQVPSGPSHQLCIFIYVMQNIGLFCRSLLQKRPIYLYCRTVGIYMIDGVIPETQRLVLAEMSSLKL